MYQQSGKQRYLEGNSGQHELRSDQVKSLLPGTRQLFGCGLITRRSQVQILPLPLPLDEMPGNIEFSGVSRFRASEVIYRVVYRPTSARACDLVVRDRDPVDVYRPPSQVAVAIMLAKSCAAVALMPGMRCW